MTTYYPFTPIPNSSFQFQPTLDGQQCIATVSWSLFGQRWMLDLNTTDGTLIVSKALIASHDGYNIQAISWNHGRVIVTTDSIHDYPVLGTFPLTIRNCSPDSYNGIFLCFILNQTQFQYSMPVNPGPVLSFGQVSSDINLIEDYFKVSTMVFRDGSQQFEVTP